SASVARIRGAEHFSCIHRRHTMSDGMRSSSPARVTRRSFVVTSGAAAAVAGFPAVLRAQAREVKVGYILPVTGPLAFEAALALDGLTLATHEIHLGGGIKSVSGAKAPRLHSEKLNK